MTTPPPPFDPSAGAPSAPQAPAAPPPPMPGATPPPIGSVPTNMVLSKPSGLALWTIITTGVVALVGLGSALYAAANIEALKEQLLNSDPTFGPADAINGLLSLVWIAAFILLAMWMTAIGNNLKMQGITPGGPPAVQWWGWFVPIAQYVLPYLGMRAISRRGASVGLLLGWWLSFCAYWLISTWMFLFGFTLVDFNTGMVSPDQVDRYDDIIVPSFAAAALLFISWAFLAMIIRNVTARHIVQNQTS